jgi:hypothetical protein
MSCDVLDPAALAHVVGGNQEVARHCNYIGNLHLMYSLGRPTGVNVPLEGEVPNVPRDMLIENRAWKARCNALGNGMDALGQSLDDIKRSINAKPYP